MRKPNRVRRFLIARLREESRERFRAELAARGVLEKFEKSTDVKEMFKLIYPSHTIPAFMFGKLDGRKP